MSIFIIKANDILPALAATLDEARGIHVDATGTTVLLHYKRRPTAERPHSVPITRLATFIPPNTARYNWADGETRKPGIYDACWIFTLPDGTTFQQTFEFEIVETGANPRYDLFDILSPFPLK